MKKVFALNMLSILFLLPALSNAGQVGVKLYACDVTTDEKGNEGEKWSNCRTNSGLISGVELTSDHTLFVRYNKPDNKLKLHSFSIDFRNQADARSFKNNLEQAKYKSVFIPSFISSSGNTAVVFPENFRDSEGEKNNILPSSLVYDSSEVRASENVVGQ